MLKARDIILKQMHLYMSNWQYALLYTLILAVFPYTSWVAVAGIALLTLRKGIKSSSLVLLPVALVLYALAAKSFSHLSALVNTCVLFIPSVIGALVLRHTFTWQAVLVAFFLLIAFIALFVHLFAPEFVINQYVYLESILKNNQGDNNVMKILAELANIDNYIVASYAFGLQLLSVFLSAIIALLFARSVQSRLYNPGGFKEEALGFRAKKIAVFILFILLLGAIKHAMLAMILLPAVFIYFLLAGVSICASLINSKNSKLTFAVFVPIALLPIFSVPFYGFLGLFDSLFSLKFNNFRHKNRG